MAFEKKVDVIIPHKNQQEYLVRALQSVLQQTRRDLICCIIVIDDHSESTEKIAEFIEEQKAIDINLKLFRSSKHGVSAARNTGISYTDAPYTAFLDSDDYWFPNKIEEQFNSFNSHPEIIANYVGQRCIELDGQIIYETLPKLKFPDAMSLLMQSDMITGSASSIIVRTEMLKKVNCFREDLRIAEDLECWLKLLRIGVIESISKPLVLITLNPQSTQRRDRNSDWYMQEYQSLLQLHCNYSKNLAISVEKLFPFTFLSTKNRMQIFTIFIPKTFFMLVKENVKLNVILKIAYYFLKFLLYKLAIKTWDNCVKFLHKLKPLRIVWRFCKRVFLKIKYELSKI